MPEFLMRFVTAVEFHAAPAAPYIQLVLGAVLAFFQTALLGALLVFLVADLLTGLWKARVLKKMASRRFGDAIDRMVFYVIIYSVLHGLTLVVPLGVFAAVPETFVMTGYVLKEALSILENMKIIQFVKGENTPLIDALIKRLGMDIDRIIKEISTESATQIPSHIGLPPEPTPVPEPGLTQPEVAPTQSSNSSGV